MITLVKLNELNRTFWQEHCKLASYYLEREYGQAWVRENYVDRRCEPTGQTIVERWENFRLEQPLTTGLISFCKSREAFTKERGFASQSRRKAQNGLGLREIVANFVSAPDNQKLGAKHLWKPYFDHLCDLGLKPTEDSLGNYIYESARGDQIKISLRQFQKIISEVSPRRKWRLNPG
jgi:hypothetical protein